MELARNLKVESVSRLEPDPLLRVTPDQPVAEAVSLMRQQGAGCVMVCSLEGTLLGIFSERDLLRRVLAEGLPLSIPVSSCMTPEPVVVQPTESVGAAIRRMEEGGYRHLPVVDPTGKPVGLLSVKQVVHYLVEHFPSTIYNQPPDPGIYPADPEGA
jgi:CBS domain-containing protein